MILESRYDYYQFSDYFKTDLPEHWVEKRLGYLAKEERAAFVDGPFGSDLKTSDYIDDGVPLIQLNNIRDSKHLMQNMKFVTEDKKQQLIRHLAIPGDVVIAKMAEPVARAAAVGNNYSEYVIVADCVKMTANLDLVDLRYLVWAINSDYVRINAELVSTGTTRIRVNLGELKKLKIPYPTYFEQQIIANFLDHETSKIDTLIEKQQQLIKLLKEKRQAVISHAVTKGLNPNAPMRDSGVEWLGEVPEHWKVMPLKYIIKAKKGAVKAGPFGSHLKNSDMEGKDVKVIAQKNVISRNFEIGESMISSDKYRELEVFTIEHNDVLITTRGTIGRTAIYDNVVTAILHPCLIRIQIDEDYAYPELVALIIQESGYAMEQILINSNATTIEVIYSENLINTIICLPPSLAEQKLLLGDISLRKTYFSVLIEKAESAIELITERRTALISAAVTGKIDVRNWQAPETLQSNIQTHKEE